jgi:hypothetical protein
VNRFRPLHQASQRQSFRPGKFGDGGEPCIAKLLWPASSVPADQSNEAVLRPGVAPVVDRLMADAALLPNRGGMFAFAQHQQSRCPQPCIPPGVIDRQLEQGFAFARRQAQGYFHQKLSGVRS